MEISAVYGGGVLKVTLAPELRSASSQVVLVPALRSVSPQLSQPADLLGRGSIPGPLTFRNLAPGSYTVYAFENSEAEYQNPEFLRTISGGKTVQIAADSDTEVTLERFSR